DHAHAAPADLPRQTVAPRPRPAGQLAEQPARRLAREEAPVVVRRRGFPPPAAAVDVQPDQLAQQGRAGRLRRVAQVLLDARPRALPPGRLEAVTDLVDAQLQRQRQGWPTGPLLLAHGSASSTPSRRITRGFRSTVRVTQPSFVAISSLV